MKEKNEKIIMIKQALPPHVHKKKMSGLLKQGITPDHWSSSFAMENVFVSLGKMLSLNCLVDRSDIRRFL